MGEPSFVDWLTNELIDREMSQSELARRAKISTGTLSNILSGYRQPGERTCRAIAKALGLPPEEVYRRAGLLPAKPERDTMTERAVADFNKLSEDDRQEILEFMALKLRRRLRGNGAANDKSKDAS